MNDTKATTFELHGELIVIKNNRQQAHRLFDALDAIADELFQPTLGIAMNVQGRVFSIGVTSEAPWTPALSQGAANIMRTLKKLLETPIAQMQGQGPGLNIQSNLEDPCRNYQEAPQVSDSKEQRVGVGHNDSAPGGIPDVPNTSDHEAMNASPPTFKSDADLGRVATFLEKAQRAARALGRDRITLKTGGANGTASLFLNRIPDEPPGPEYNEGVDCELVITVTGIKQAPATLEVDIRKHGDAQVDVRAKIPIVGEAAGEAIEKLMNARQITVQARMFCAGDLCKYELEGTSLISALSKAPCAPFSSNHKSVT